MSFRQQAAGSPVVAANSARRASNNTITPHPPLFQNKNENSNNNNSDVLPTMKLSNDNHDDSSLNLGNNPNETFLPLTPSIIAENANNGMTNNNEQSLNSNSTSSANNNSSTLASVNSSAIQQMIAKDLSKYSEEDLNQIKELYQTLIETGALRLDANGGIDGSGNGIGGLPNAFQLLGSEIPGRKSVTLKSLIRKHGLGVDKNRQSAASFQALVNMLCVPIREKRHHQELLRREASRHRSFRLHDSTTGDEMVISSSSNRRRKSVNFRDGEHPATGSDLEDNDEDERAQRLKSSSAAAAMGLSRRSDEDGETPSRTSSPDLFGDLRSNSPSTPQPHSRRGDGEGDDDNEPSPERLLEKLENVTSNQSERSKRAKRIINLSRKDLYAACEIEPVSAYNAGYDQGKMKKKSNAKHPLLIDEEAKAETARYMRQMAKPRGIQPSPFHGAAARVIGEVNQPQPQLVSSSSSPSSTARSNRRSSSSGAAIHYQNETTTHHNNSSRPPLSPRTPNQKHVGFHTKKSSPRKSRPQSAVSNHNHNNNDSFNHTYNTTSENDTTMTSGIESSSDDDDDDDDMNHSYLSVKDQNNESTTSQSRFPSIKNQSSSGRRNLRSGGLHALYDEPQKYKKKQPVVKNLSAKVKLKEAEREMHQEHIELGGFATPRTLARRLTKIEDGEKVMMFDDVESRILQRWLR